MTQDMYQTYTEMKEFVGFGAADAANLKALAPIFEAHGHTITEKFYGILETYPQTAKQIEGRVESLKKTHHAWMMELFEGEYAEAYFDRRKRIGEAHVRIGLDPFYVEGTMSVMRTESETVIHAHVADQATATAGFQSLLKLLDLDLIVINMAYAEERVERICAITGMRRGLVENLVRRGGKKKRSKKS